jgi:hypothetical protein
MRIIMNSDLLYHGPLVRDSLSSGLTRFLEGCRDKGHVVCIPETAKLEFERDQGEKRAKKMSSIAKAYQALDEHGIAHDLVDPEALVPRPNIVTLVAATGVTVEVLEPTLEDYQDAHRRAALHEPPHPPGSKSDEMRDLVIWSNALRVARADGAAVLLSRDQVHTHSRGDAEANAAGLMRISDLDEALTHFEIGTPSALALLSMFTPVWPQLIEAGLPLLDEPRIAKVGELAFIQGEQGIAAASGSVGLPASGGVLLADVDAQLAGSGTEELLLSSIRLPSGDEVADVGVTGPAPDLSSYSVDYEGRLQALKQVIGDTP